MRCQNSGTTNISEMSEQWHHQPLGATSVFHLWTHQSEGCNSTDNVVLLLTYHTLFCADPLTAWAQYSLTSTYYILHDNKFKLLAKYSVVLLGLSPLRTMSRKPKKFTIFLKISRYIFFVMGKCTNECQNRHENHDWLLDKIWPHNSYGDPQTLKNIQNLKRMSFHLFY